MERKKVALYVLLVVTVLCVVFLPGYSRLNKIRESNDELRKRIALLEQRNEEMKKELLRMKEDPVYLEGKARNKLGIVKKGEVVYKKAADQF